MLFKSYSSEIYKLNNLLESSKNVLGPDQLATLKGQIDGTVTEYQNRMDELYTYYWS